jgi:hypothetical protein
MLCPLWFGWDRWAARTRRDAGPGSGLWCGAAGRLTEMAAPSPGGRALALGGPEDAGAVLVAALVGVDLLGAIVVAVGEEGLHPA